jgi:hypothetical protein
MTTYKTDIELGKRYRDEQTGIEGTATAITFYQHGCERASIEVVVREKIEEYGFDVPRLTNVETRKQATSARTGGPAKGASHTRPGAVER